MVRQTEWHRGKLSSQTAYLCMSGTFFYLIGNFVPYEIKTLRELKTRGGCESLFSHSVVCFTFTCVRCTTDQDNSCMKKSVPEVPELG